MIEGGHLCLVLWARQTQMLKDRREHQRSTTLGHLKPQFLINTTFNIKISISEIKFPEKIFKKKRSPLWLHFRTILKRSVTVRNLFLFTILPLSIPTLESHIKEGSRQQDLCFTCKCSKKSVGQNVFDYPSCEHLKVIQICNL